MTTQARLMSEIATGDTVKAGSGADSPQPPLGTCLWCGKLFPPRSTGGLRQRFCQPAHRRAFETAARQLVGRLIAAGQLSVDSLHASPATRALLPGAISDVGATTLPGKALRAWVTPVCVLWAEPCVASVGPGK